LRVRAGAPIAMRSVDILKLAADALATDRVAPDPRVSSLLEALEYAPRGDEIQAPLRDNQARLLGFAAQFEDFFQLDSPFAPGLAFFGGMVSPALAGPSHRGSPSVSVTGRGMTLRNAFEGCVGEAIEYVSQLSREHDAAFDEGWDRARDTLDARTRQELDGWLTSAADPRLQWMNATRLSDGALVALPVDVCLRRPPAQRAFVPPFLMGTGTAAGVSMEAATQHAVLELIERDALGLWWKGGRRGLAVDGERAEFALTIGALRRGRADRETWLLDITTDLAVPCVVAVSCAADGGEFAFGAAARLTLADAARTALLELCQLELALHVVQRKARERGAEALNAADREHLARATTIDAKTCPLLQPIAERGEAAAEPADLTEIVARATKLGVEFHRADITRNPPGVAAVRVVAPTLQLEPSRLVSARLARVIAATGGGDVYNGGARLL
jgi:ribosomal protein S12 methylthiotransferase accessory factor